MTSQPRGSWRESRRQREKDATWALGLAELGPRRLFASSRTRLTPEPRITVSWVIARGAGCGPGVPWLPRLMGGSLGQAGTLVSGEGRRPGGGKWPRAAAWSWGAALGKETLRRWGQRLSQPSCGPHGQVPATGPTEKLGPGTGDLGEVVSPLVCRRLLKRCF